jgi:rod shape-determining protein MreC
MLRPADRKRIFALAALLAAVVLALLGLFRPVSGLGQRVVGAVAAPIHWAGHSLAGLFNGGCAETDPALQAKIDRLTVENAKLKSLATENDQLKASLGFLEQGGDQTVMARVIYEADDGVSRMLVLDHGAADGLRVGQAVIAGDGIIVGKIATVRQATAKVMLLTDSRSRLAVTVQNATETLGVLEGDRGLSLSMQLVPQTESLAAGQTIITSGLEPGIRRGLVVGTIDKVDRPPREPFQSASVNPFTSWEHPLVVQILTPAETVAGL